MLQSPRKANRPPKGAGPVAPRCAEPGRILLLSAYELGHQPLGLTLPAALLRLARTPRIHLTAATLVEPRSGRTWMTLLPRARAAARRSVAS